MTWSWSAATTIATKLGSATVESLGHLQWDRFKRLDQLELARVGIFPKQAKRLVAHGHPLAAVVDVVVVVLDAPNGATDGGRYDMRFGGTSAAPIFAEIAESALHQLGVSPTHDGDD